MNNIEDRILKEFKDNIAISNLRKEYIMKKSIAKKVTSLSLIGILCVFGSFFTVNAATGGELVNNIKEIVYTTFTIEKVGNLKVDKVFDGVDYKTITSGDVKTGTYTFEENEDGTNTIKVHINEENDDENNNVKVRLFYNNEK